MLQSEYMHHLDAATHIIAASDQISSDVDGEAVILSLTNGVYYGLDEVGARIWGFMQEPVSITSLVELLLEKYDVDARQCEHDVRALLAELYAVGLISSIQPDQ